MTDLFIPYPDTMSDCEMDFLSKMKAKQEKRIQGDDAKPTEVVTKKKFTKPTKPANPGRVKLGKKTTKKEKKEQGEDKMRNPIDMYGNTIQNGDYINYPVRKGSSTYMRTAKVLKVRERKDHVDNKQVVLDVAVAIAPRAWERKGNWQDNIKVRRVTVSCPYRSTIVPKSYIQHDKRYNTLLTY